jgi:hypothetical protein
MLGASFSAFDPTRTSAEMRGPGVQKLIAFCLQSDAYT